MVERSKRLASSLVETIVTLGIMAFIMVGAYQIFHEGIQYFNANQAAADAQMSSLKVLGRITSEVSVAKPDLVEAYSEGGAAPPGIVFATSLADSGTTRFHPTRGEIYWQKWVCYYFEADPSGGVNGKVYRCEEVIPAEDSGGDGHTDIVNVVRPGLLDRDTAYFRDHTSLARRLVSDQVSSLDIKLYSGEVGEAGGAVRDTYDVIVASGDKDGGQRDGYYIQVDSKVTPKG